MPAYVVTVLLAYLVYHFRTAGPNPGHTWEGLFRNLTLTQLYTDNYVYSYLHQGLTQMWSLAVEVSFYAVLPGLAYLLLVVLCRRQWRPWLLLASMAALGLITPLWLMLVHDSHWLPDGATLWLPTYLLWFLGGMALAVLQSMGVRCYGFVAVPLALICYFIAATPIAGEPTTSPKALSEAIVKAVFYAVIAALVLAPPGAGDQRGWYNRFLASRPWCGWGDLLRDLPGASGAHGDRDGRDPAQAGLHRIDGRTVRRDDGADHPGVVVAAPVHPGAVSAPYRRPC